MVPVPNFQENKNKYRQLVFFFFCQITGKKIVSFHLFNLDLMVLVPNFQENKNKYRQLVFCAKKLEKKLLVFFQLIQISWCLSRIFEKSEVLIMLSIQKKNVGFLLDNIYGSHVLCPDYSVNKNKYWLIAFYVKQPEEDCWFSSSYSRSKGGCPELRKKNSWLVALLCQKNRKRIVGFHQVNLDLMVPVPNFQGKKVLANCLLC